MAASNKNDKNVPDAIAMEDLLRLLNNGTAGGDAIPSLPISASGPLALAIPIMLLLKRACGVTNLQLMLAAAYLCDAIVDGDKDEQQMQARMLEKLANKPEDLFKASAFHGSVMGKVSAARDIIQGLATEGLCSTIRLSELPNAPEDILAHLVGTEMLNALGIKAADILR